MRLLKHLALLLLVTLASGPAHAATLSRETSPGGHPYVLIRMPDKDKVAIRMAWATDWPARPDANQAVPYLGTRLIITGGAEGWPPGEVVETMSDLNAETDLLAYSQIVKGKLDVPRANLAEAVTIVNAHLRAPLLPQNWFERARDELAKSAAERRTKPEVAAADVLRWAVYGDAPLRRFIIDETPERINAVELPEVAAWHQSVFTSNPVWIAVAGPLYAAEAGQAVDQMLAGLPAGKTLLPLVLEADMRPRRILLHMPDAVTSTLYLTGAMPPTRQGWTLQDSLLLEAMSRDLMQAARTELRATYDVSGYPFYDSDRIAFFSFSAQMQSGQLEPAEQALRKAYAAYRAGKGTNDTVAVKPFVLDRMRSRVQEPAGAADEAIYSLETGEDIRAVSEPEAVLAPVTFDTMKARMDQVFPQPDALMVIAVSPDAGALPGACVITRPEQAAGCK